MTTNVAHCQLLLVEVVEAYRLDRYDNMSLTEHLDAKEVVEAYRLDRYDNL